jgi:hypothetical protein
MTANPRLPAALILIVALAAFAAWRVIGLGMAGHAARHAPEDAQAWRGDHAVALRLSSARAWERGDAAAAAELALRAVKANPLDGRAYGVLALARSVDDAMDVGLASIAARRWPLDAAAHESLAMRHLGDGDLAAAMPHLDALLRVYPESRGETFALLLRLLVELDAPPALTEWLGQGPPWRGAFLAHAARTLKDPAPMHQLFRALVASDTPPGEHEQRAWLARLERDGLYIDAWFTWIDSLPPERLDGLGNLHNGSFEWPASGFGFDWRFGRVAGAVIEQAPAGGADGDMALRVAFQHQRVDFRHVSQLLVLPPGEYRLAGRVRLDNLRNERGLIWQVQCARGRAGRLGQSDGFRGLSPWRSFEFTFRVPEADCPAQWLRLELDARAAADRFIGGEAWFDAMRIQRLP